MAIEDEEGEQEMMRTRNGDPVATCTVVGGRNSALVRSLVSMLLKSQEWDMRIADPRHSAQITAEEEDWGLIESDLVDNGSVHRFQVDVLDRSQLLPAMKGSSVVFLMDLGESYAQNYYQCYMLLVQGTKNIITICKEFGIKRLIYNSSADVVFDGIHDIQNGNESLPYPHKFEDRLHDLKAQVEAMILFTNGQNGLLTCALRPSNTFGPGDACFVNLFIDRAKQGGFEFIIGSGQNVADFTYVENVAHAHVLADKALCSQASSVAGKAFFLTNLEPMKIWEFISSILEGIGIGYQRPQIHFPVKFILSITMLLEWLYGLLPLQKNAQSCLTPAMIHTLSCTRTFECSKAQKFLGYSPIVSLEDGIRLTFQSFSNSTKVARLTQGHDFIERSKADKFLGSGGVAEILLWRDEKKTFSYLVGLFFLFYWFVLSGRTCIASACYLLLLVTVVLFVHGNLPSSIHGFTVKEVSSSWFEISEISVKSAIKSLASMWNQGAYIWKSLGQGNDGRLFLKVAGFMYLLARILQFSLSTLLGVGLVCMFTVFIVHEQHEVELNQVLMILSVCVLKSRKTLIRILPGFLADHIHESQVGISGHAPFS